MVERNQSICTESIDVVCLAKDDSVGLTRTLLSILEQEFQPRLVLVSPSMLLFQEDSIMSLLQGIDNYRIIHDRGDGIYQAMNFAISNLTEDAWVWFLNAGDAFYNSSAVSEVLRSIKTSDSRWIVGNFRILDEEGDLVGVMIPNAPFSVASQLFARDYVSHQATLMHLSLLKFLNGFDIKYKVAADWDLICRASLIEQPLYVDQVLVDFFLGGFSTHNRATGNRELLNLRKKYLGSGWVIVSLSWYFYRIPRNAALSFIERHAPKLVKVARSSKRRLKSSE